MTTARVSAKGEVVIPAKVRKDLGITPGSKVTIRREGGVVLVSPVSAADPVATYYGILKSKSNKSVTAWLIQEHKREVKRDEKRLRQWL